MTLRVQGRYSNIMRGAYWYTQCRPYFGWGYDPCKSLDCYNTCVAMCERSYEFKEPGFVLHYHGCNLNCKFCWAYNIRLKEPIFKTVEEVVKDLLCKLNALYNDQFIAEARIKPLRISTLRLTGNEPTLQWGHVMELLKTLDDPAKIYSICERIPSIKQQLRQSFTNVLHNLKIIIQTNGVEIGKPNSPIEVEDLLGIRNLSIYIEVSFKGVNPDQFTWLTDCPPELFEYQCAGFERLWRVKRKSNNIHVIPELGINHCDTIKGFPELGIRIIDAAGCPMDFTKYSLSFKEKVLKNAYLEEKVNEFQEFRGINRERARLVIETYSKQTGEVKKNCLPSEFYRNR